MPKPPRSPALIVQPDHFQAPRELEHPLVAVTAVATPILFWTQPRLMQPAYELWAEEQVVATLRYRGRLGGEALAASAEGLWRFAADAAGRGRVWIYGADGAAGTLEPEPPPSAGCRYRLRLTEGLTYTWLADRGDCWAVENELGAEVLRLQSVHDPRPGLRIERAGDTWHRLHAFLALVGKHLNLTVARAVGIQEPLYLPGRSGPEGAGGRVEA